MKITNITTEEYRWPRHTPISNGLHTYTHSGLALAKIATDEGITGIGLGGGGPIGRATIEVLKPLLIGEDPHDVERLWHAMWVPKLIGRRGMTTRAISALDIGLWDIKANPTGSRSRSSRTTTRGTASWPQRPASRSPPGRTSTPATASAT